MFFFNKTLILFFVLMIIIAYFIAIFLWNSIKIEKKNKLNFSKLETEKNGIYNGIKENLKQNWGLYICHNFIH